MSVGIDGGDFLVDPIGVTRSRARGSKTRGSNKSISPDTYRVGSWLLPTRYLPANPTVVTCQPHGDLPANP